MNESARMVAEAYEAIAAVHTVPLVRVTKVPDHPDITAAQQLFQMGLLTRRKYMEMLEEQVYPQVWVEP